MNIKWLIIFLYEMMLPEVLMHFVFPEPVVGLHVSLRNLVTQRLLAPFNKY